MPVDPRLFAGPDIVGAYSRGLQVREQMDQRQDKKRLADLLPRAVQGDRDAISQIAEVDPGLFLKLDERQRQQAQTELSDVASAVKWSMADPAQRAQRWDQVVDYYSQHVPDIAQYRGHPELAETALLRLGQIGSYLKGDGNPTNLEREYEFLRGKDPALADQFLHNRAEGSPLVANNGDGTFTIIPRGFGGNPAPQGGPQPGQVVNGYRFKGGNPNDRNSWEPVGGPSPGGSGGFL